MKKAILVILIVVLAFSFTGNSFANLSFSIHVQQTKDQQDADKKIYQEKNEYDMSVDLGDTYFSYTRGGILRIYDFVKKRLITIELSNKIYSDDSLFATILYRTMEFQNRLWPGGIFNIPRFKKDIPMASVFNEHLLSLEQKDKKPEVSEISKDGFLHFSSEGKELLSYSTKGEEVSPDNKKMFITFFRYVFAGHPQILKKLSSDNVIPKSMCVNQFDSLLSETNLLTISMIKSTPDMLYSLENYIPGVLSNDKDRFSKILHDIKYSKTIDMESRLELLQSRASEYFKNGNYLDMMLAYLECSLSSDLPLPKAFVKRKKVLEEADTISKLYLTIKRKKNIKEAEESLAILQEWEKNAKNERYLLKYYEANHQSRIGKRQEAKDLYYEVIKASPLITGVYKDIGLLFFKEYDTVLAWRCWDVARKIAPKHDLLSQINEGETNLYKNYPEYF